MQEMCRSCAGDVQELCRRCAGDVQEMCTSADFGKSVCLTECVELRARV